MSRIDVKRTLILGAAAVRPANVSGSDVVHSSGIPALRRPSISRGMFERGGNDLIEVT
jgi:hypothetical protein